MELKLILVLGIVFLLIGVVALNVYLDKDLDKNVHELDNPYIDQNPENHFKGGLVGEINEVKNNGVV